MWWLFVSSPLTLEVKLHKFTPIQRKTMYKICGGKKQLFHRSSYTFFQFFLNPGDICFYDDSVINYHGTKLRGSARIEALILTRIKALTLARIKALISKMLKLNIIWNKFLFETYQNAPKSANFCKNWSKLVLRLVFFFNTKTTYSN